MKNVNTSAHCPTGLDISRAVALLKQGEVVGIPTETYYGLAVDPDNEYALEKLFAVKKRPAHKPILILIADIDQLYHYTDCIPEQYKILIQQYWPGPLTLVFNASSQVSPLLTGGTGSVGIRLTPDPYARKIIESFGKPITATSANLSSLNPARNAQEVANSFGNAISYVVDGGPSTEGPGSTVVTIIEERLCMLRQGRITLPGVPLCS